MRGERGAVMPSVMIFTFLFLGLFLHQANLFLLEKHFYYESEQFFRLENMMNHAVVELQRDVQGRGIPAVYEYEEGTAHISYSSTLPRQLQISIRCVTKEGRVYTASFLYDPDSRSITNWREER